MTSLLALCANGTHPCALKKPTVDTPAYRLERELPQRGYPLKTLDIGTMNIKIPRRQGELPWEVYERKGTGFSTCAFLSLDCLKPHSGEQRLVTCRGIDLAQGVDRFAQFYDRFTEWDDIRQKAATASQAERYHRGVRNGASMVGGITLLMIAASAPPLSIIPAGFAYLGMIMGVGSAVPGLGAAIVSTGERKKRVLFEKAIMDLDEATGQFMMINDIRVGNDAYEHL